MAGPMFARAVAELLRDGLIYLVSPHGETVREMTRAEYMARLRTHGRDGWSPYFTRTAARAAAARRQRRS